MPENVIHMPGATFRPENVDDPLAPKHVLENVMRESLLDIVCVGRCTNGEIVVYGSHPNADAAAGLLMRGVKYVLMGPQVPHEEPMIG